MKQGLLKNVIALTTLLLLMLFSLPACGQRQNNESNVVTNNEWQEDNEAQENDSIEQLYTGDEIREKIVGEWYSYRTYDEPYVVFSDDGTGYFPGEGEFGYKIGSVSKTMIYEAHYSDNWTMEIDFHNEKDDMHSYFLNGNTLIFWGERLYRKEMPKGELFNRILGTWKSEMDDKMEITFQSNSTALLKMSDEDGAGTFSEECKFAIDEKSYSLVIYERLNFEYDLFSSSVATWCFVDSESTDVLKIMGNYLIKSN